MTKTKVVITTAEGTADCTVGLDEAGRTAARQLRKEMHQPAKGTWYNARLELQPSGKLNADFDYDNPPFDGDADADLLLEDQRLFPRDGGHLPGWHPAASR
ncbi:immunity protein YezG family protein [Kribbella deserti]|uniref:Immunity protein YezG family protein n=1 Tax=Kribbella deserti TaxID=1926257 RepID=A0ABV6QTC9_9ACTN